MVLSAPAGRRFLLWIPRLPQTRPRGYGRSGWSSGLARLTELIQTDASGEHVDVRMSPSIAHSASALSNSSKLPPLNLDIGGKLLDIGKGKRSQSDHGAL